MSTVEIPLMSRDEEDRERKPKAEGSLLRLNALQGWGSNVISGALASVLVPLRLKALDAWRFTVASGALGGVVILLINIITLAAIYGGNDMVNNSVTFFTGSCTTARNVTIGAHVVINILSTILLAYSNFSMQCLGSPTRREIDLAHSKQIWLHIGVPSVRNLFFISKKKAALWLVLAASSFPLHMIWNSTVFETKVSYDYIAATVSEDFLDGANWTVPRRIRYPNDNFDEYDVTDYSDVLSVLQRQAVEKNPELEKLTTEDCIHKYYDTDMISDRQHVLLVFDDKNESQSSSVQVVYNNANTLQNSQLDPFTRWMCDSPSQSFGKECDIKDRRHWIPGLEVSNGGMLGSKRVPIQSCYSQTKNETCKVNIIPAFMIVVIVCNIAKISSFIAALYITQKDPPLCTTGDAIQSFLKFPDSYTRGRCLVAKDDYEKLISRSREWDSRPSGVGDTWTGGRFFWGKAVNRWQWISYSVITAGCLLAFLLVQIPSSSHDGYLGSINVIGEPQSQDIVYDKLEINVLTGFLLANIPQVLISYIYLALNNILSSMLAMAEWCSYSTRSGVPVKGLRVSSPLPDTAQRSTYFLSLPYKWAIPTTVVITVLHWLVSQMFFFARVELFKFASKSSGQIHTIEKLYWSSFTMTFVISLGYAILAIIIGIGYFRHYPDIMPLAGCCSASIAASCHSSRVYEDDAPIVEVNPQLASQRLCWGAVEEPHPEINGNVGHATFSATETVPLMRERMYA